MNYEDMSDLEINAQVTMLDYNLQGWEYSDNMQQFFHCGVCGSETHNQPIIDYCNSWDDMGPIMVENNIAVMPDSDGTWKSGSLPVGSAYTIGWANFTMSHKNPLRAAAIVFIMMKDSTKND